MPPFDSNIFQKHITTVNISCYVRLVGEKITPKHIQRVRVEPLMRINVNNGNIVALSGIRNPSINIDGQSFSNAESVIRAALLFEIEQHSNTLSAMAAEGESTEDRVIFVDKRRCAFAVLELIDGVIYAPNTETANPVMFPVIINNYTLTTDMVTALRQALVTWKRFKARDPMMVLALDTMTNYMLYGKEETRRRAHEAHQAKAKTS